MLINPYTLCIRFGWLLLILLATQPGFGQHFELRQFQLQSSLPSTFVYKVHEDQRGFIWFLTDKGIAYYNGSQVKYISQADGYESAGAFHVIEDKTGALWFLTVDFKIYKFTNNKFFRIQTPIRIGWIDKDQRGNVYAASRDSVDGFSVYRILSSTLQLLRISKPFNDIVFNMLVLDTNHLLFGFGSSIDYYKNKKRHTLLPSRTYLDRIPPRLHRTPRGIFISNYFGLYLYDTSSCQIKLVYPFPEKEIISLSYIDGSYWVATQRGLFRFYDTITPQSKPEVYLAEYAVMGIVKSHDQMYWIPTYELGVFVSNFQSKQINAKEGLLAEKISHIRIDGDDLCFFGRSKSYYRYHNGMVESFKLPVFHPYKHSTNYAMNVFVLPDSSLFVHGKSNGVIKKGKVYQDPYLLGGLPPILSINSKGLVYFYDGALWLNGVKQCLVTNEQLLQLREEVLAQNFTLAKPIPVYIDNDEYYFQTDKGLIRASWDAKQIKPKWNDLRISGKISHICKWQEALIVSTQNEGLYIVNGSKITHFTSLNGLLSMYVEKAVVLNNQLWICTNQGLSSISDLKSMQIRHFTANDYLLDNEVQDVALFNDTLFVATATSVSLFPKQATIPAFIPSVIVEKIEINHQPWLLTDRYVLDYHQNNILLQVASPGYRFANQKRYRVFIKKNAETDTLYYRSGNIQLSALSSGLYKVSVAVQHIDGNWSMPSSELVFDIKPPFWQTIWFWLSLVSTSVVIVVLWIRTRFLNKQRLLESKRKIAESELKSLRLHMNPHFIFNILTSLQSFILTNQNRKAEVFIAKFSKLIRAIMGYSVKGQLLLSEEVAFLNNYIELEKTRFQYPFQHHIHWSSNIEPHHLTIPSLLVQPFVENAIKHGIKDQEPQAGSIEIYFYKIENRIWCRIEDNGIGRNLEKNIQHESTGIRFTEERIQLLLNKPQSQMVFITDLSNQNKPCGTRVEVCIPDLTQYD
ncbi:MAG: histidine kinase [Bacteroidia bacterium]|jgi:ligand-binding sensor domain-containing protein/two-component sensor histidine kinase|nr:histidine kinase [Bacteroidia bacterium]